jgi:hypothetical protein
MVRPLRSSPNVSDKVEALEAMLMIMQSRPNAFDPAAIRAVWARLGALTVEAGGARRVA